jgi:polyisoprenoid-binding protein YceI
LLFAFATNPHIIYPVVDAKESSVKWTGSKIASSHEGYVKILKGSLAINHGLLEGGEFAIDMNSISCSDIENEKYNKKLVDHLKNEDFFNTKDFPLATIKITSVKRGKAENEYKIYSDLTIKGITHPISFKANVDIDGEVFVAKAKISIDRTKWDIKYGSGNFFDNLGDKMILDDILLNIALISVK